MGLDMYLHKKTNVKNYSFYSDKETTLVTVTRNGESVKSIDPSKVSMIEQEVGYWRKFNALHLWFVNNVQGGKDDCAEYYVKKDKMEELLQVLKEVSNDHSKAPELLPTGNGFFFGNTDYDEWYFNDVNRSIMIFEDILKTSISEDDLYSSYHYQASW